MPAFKLSRFQWLIYDQIEKPMNCTVKRLSSKAVFEENIGKLMWRRLFMKSVLETMEKYI